MPKKDSLAALAETQDNLDLLDSGINVDRLIAVSNAQGSIAKLIQSVLLGALAIQELKKMKGNSSPPSKKVPKRLPAKK